MNWQDIEGWFDFPDLYDEAVATASEGDLLLEIGCYLGKSLCYLGSKAKAANKNLRVVGVEVGTGSGNEDGNDYHATALARGNGSLIGELHSNILQCELADTVSVVVAPSVVAASFFPADSLHFVFIDANHKQVFVEADITAWLSRVRSGGILAGHDYTRHWTGVVAAVDRLLPTAKPCSLASWSYTKS